jgi:hypothetical protein
LSSGRGKPDATHGRRRAPRRLPTKTGDRRK